MECYIQYFFGCNDESSKDDIVNQTGRFYSLEKAFENQFLTKDDLESIAHYLHTSESYLEPLDNKIEKSIKETRVIELLSYAFEDGTERYPNANIDEVEVVGYYGKYEDCYAVMLTEHYHEFGQATRTVEIGGVVFNYRDGNSILIWIMDSNYLNIIS